MIKKTLGSLKEGTPVIVEGLDIRCNPTYERMVLTQNKGDNVVLTGDDGIGVLTHSSCTEFFIDTPVTRKSLNI